MRYIDDILFIWEGSSDELCALIDRLNQNEINVKLTFKYGRSLEFLDIFISASPDGHLNTDIFRKQTATNSFLLAQSSHPRSMINGIPIGQFLRAKRICLDDQAFEKQSEDLVRRFIERGYSKRSIKRGYSRASKINRDQLLYGQSKNKKESSNMDTIEHLFPFFHMIFSIWIFHTLEETFPVIRRIFEGRRIIILCGLIITMCILHGHSNVHDDILAIFDILLACFSGIPAVLYYYSYSAFDGNRELLV
ncbi:uncharacterized protein [Dendrobates tinctorius]|uniref:uncharacterized protein n=1 Tax=Dendrobates tinctorius TaxID=92724 RepID=UPI003CC9EA34